MRSLTKFSQFLRVFLPTLVFSKMFVLRSMGNELVLSPYRFLCLISMFSTGFSKSLWINMPH